ncbi:hypothetical protein [uncultured Roseobacter sp.]|nr:hypothetical protein [uncultured Roseobacter sp.]
MTRDIVNTLAGLDKTRSLGLRCASASIKTRKIIRFGVKWAVFQ